MSADPTPINERIIEREYERLVGIQVYSTTTAGIGGIVKKKPADFIVEEITPEKYTISTRQGESDDLSAPHGGHRYTIFDLVKYKRDTIMAVKDLARALGLPQSKFSFAGIKDNRAITAQRVSVKGIHSKVLSRLQVPKLEVYNIQFSKNPVRVGELWGNAFNVVIRDVQSAGEELESPVKETAAQITSRSFPNYFGLQRFGTHRPNTHEMGKLILQGNYEEAVKRFLVDVFDREFEPAREARESLQDNWDYGEALDSFPQGLVYERMIMEFLESHPEDYLGALKILPYTLQNLIISAYQSYVFNVVLSARTREVQLDQPGEHDTAIILHDADGLPSKVSYPYEGHWKEKIDRAMKKHRAVVGIPLVGVNTQYNQSLISELCQKQLEQDGVTRENFKLRDLPHLKPFRGTFRPMTVRPTNLHYSIDLEGNSVRLRFELPKGTYATMLLREFTK